eukprot:TRINITY_DN13699_c0_g1_i1.p1 TRINITY_DN13699_c0_g1~~TRINITY_DN13699_c0_g1_i1.p1  ORF type:complete len:626 (+),score=175.90 TRINITY_DN13699_c0_g1_i1:95-1972(+)
MIGLGLHSSIRNSQFICKRKMSSNSLSALQKLDSIRNHMKKESVSAYLIYSEDGHQSEYTPDRDKRRGFISNFHGSAGSALITNKEALLWTDGRYFLQASKELDPDHWKLMKANIPGTPTIPEWISKNLKNENIGFDAKLVSQFNFDGIEKELKGNGSKLVAVNDNLIDLVWSKEQPSYPSNSISIHPNSLAGTTREEKIKNLREEIKKEGVDAFVVTSLDEIAWLFNLRGSDISFNPVFIAYALVPLEGNATIYVNKSKFSPEVEAELGKEISIKPYDQIFQDVTDSSSNNKKIWLDPKRSCVALFRAVKNENLILSKDSPITIAKSLKTEVELEGMRQAHIRDGAALTSFFSWLEDELRAGKTLTESEAADKVDWFRSQQPDFVSLSFDTISSTGPNGAIIHYKPSSDNCSVVDINKIYLCDSGGQYKDGTTDVTRTLHFGEPTSREKRCFTRVLQGHIAIDTVVFPEGTNGGQLDPMARLPLWKEGLDYMHGTGHGVGAFLNVHEGPQGIHFRETAFKTAFKAGMTITNEPGYYEDGNFGIRIENVLITKEASTPNNFAGKKYLCFENITFAPIQTKMVDVSIMSPEEIKWLNDYNKSVLEKVGPLLSGRPLEWLKRETQPI